MAIFVNQTQGYFLLTNFKVMYSSLSFESDLQEIFLNNYLDCLKFKSQQSQKPTIMLVRNPYTKLISFFEDKFIRHPNMSIEAKVKYCGKSDWQKCQKIFFPYLNIEPVLSMEEVTKRLEQTSFEEFSNCLPHIYLQDYHLSPQINTLKFCKSIKSLNKNVYFSEPITVDLRVDEIFKLENLEPDFLGKKLSLNLPKARNKTHYTKPWESYFTNSEVLAIVNDLYQEDFTYFDYPQYHSVKELLRSPLANS